MRTCPNPKCKNIIDNDNAKFCKKCGCELALIPTAVHEEEDEDDNKNYIQLQKSNEGIKLSLSRIESLDSNHTDDVVLNAHNSVSSNLSHKQLGFSSNNIGNEKVNHKKSTKRSTREIIRFIFLILLAAILALVIPIILTPFTNRIIADATHQWYLSNGTRVLITLFVTSATYSIAYLIIRFTSLKKSIIFNSICLILTFLWCIFVGVVLMPD